MIMKIHNQYLTVESQSLQSALRAKKRTFLLKNFILFSMLSLSVSGCKEFISVDEPQGQMLSGNVFNDNIAAIAAMTSLYSQIQYGGFWSYYIPLYTGLSADELTNYATFQNQIEFYTNSLNQFTGGYINIWRGGFNYLYQVNSVIEGLNISSSLDSRVKQQLMGEALFFRAFINFYLVNLFGEIPIVVSSDYTLNTRLERSPVHEVYGQIAEDLINAGNLLNEYYVSSNSVSLSTERVRPNKLVATALLARCYLYMEDWQNAQKCASDVINSGVYTLEDNFDSIFLKESQEAIWQLMSPALSAGNSNTYEGMGFILTGAPNNLSLEASTTISPQLYEAFEEDDQRKLFWIGHIDANDNTYFFPYKYRVKSSNSIEEYSIVFRLSEQYLIRAEANAKLGAIQESIADVNIVRERAGLNALTTINGSTLSEIIENERRSELFTEWGHRWFDFKRTGKIHEVMPEVSESKGGVWQQFRQYWPIPNSEIERNPNLTQNIGYDSNPSL